VVAFAARWRKSRVSREELLFPSFNYYLDESDPDIVILRRQDDSFVAAFSAMGATREGIIGAAKTDYGELIRDNSSWRGNGAVEHRGA
jgi:hypothetical protein